jgi:hypothetical protein
MTAWLFGTLVVMGIGVALYGLHRLGLWLEDRGLLYYCRRKPDSSPASVWVAMQQFVEPGVKHVREVRQENRKADEEGCKEQLLACFELNTVNTEQVRLLLVAARRAGLDWDRLYAEAVQIHLSVRPHRAALIPPLKAVAPAAGDYPRAKQEGQGG